MSRAWKIYAVVLAAVTSWCVYLATSGNAMAPVFWAAATFSALMLLVIWIDLCTRKD